MKQYALLSVTDKTGLDQLAREIDQLGISILSTGGSAKYLKEAGLAPTQVSDYTGFPEILGGRVKTLHPNIHAGILARSSDREFLQSMELSEILIVVANLYPFKEMASKGYSVPELAEYIDVGGPTMIRAAAKNWERVYAVTHPDQYAEVIEVLQLPDQQGSRALSFRQQLAAQAFSLLSDYDSAISQVLLQNGQACESDGPTHDLDQAQIDVVGMSSLRYGENPHQQAAFLRLSDQGLGWSQLQGKELSYNNLIDLDNALQWLYRTKASENAAVAIFKHASPCGAALSDNQIDALQRARATDPRSHFGGIIACNQNVSEQLASAIIEHFTEIVVAPGFSDGALAILSKRQNLRVVLNSAESSVKREFRSACGGLLMQEPDSINSAEIEGIAQHPRRNDLILAWHLCQLLRSNAIVFVKDSTMLAGGVGETSRIDALENAVRKASLHKHDLHDAVLASDAFFPFPDSIELIAQTGVSVILSPSGSVKDGEVQAKAHELGLELIFMPCRHFRH